MFLPRLINISKSKTRIYHLAAKSLRVELLKWPEDCLHYQHSAVEADIYELKAAIWNDLYKKLRRLHNAVSWAKKLVNRIR